jgi:hypothetical protein
MTNAGTIQSEEGHWKSHAIRWDKIGPPLRPSPDELAVVAVIVSQLMSQVGNRGLDALILGVTPEYARFPWPPKSNLIALDRCEAMIRHVWPGSTAASERTLCGDWLAPDASLGPIDPVLDCLRRYATIREVRFPGYRVGDCCPMVVLEA